jgi:hypothetical protein
LQRESGWSFPSATRSLRLVSDALVDTFWNVQMRIQDVPASGEYRPRLLYDQDFRNCMARLFYEWAKAHFEDVRVANLFKGAIGVVGGLVLPFADKPDSDDAHWFLNRKGKYSFAAQVVAGPQVCCTHSVLV